MTNVIYPDLKSKTVVVTGAGDGIGKAIAKAFLDQDSKVVLISRSDMLWLDEIDSSQYIFIKSEIQNIEYIEKWLEHYILDGNKIDILINNAGVISQQKLMDTTEEHWDGIVDINSKSTFFVTQLFARHMIKNNTGNIIFATSYATKLSSFSYGIYAASKAMILSLSKSFAAELAPYNIRVNSFSPGVIETRMTKQAIKNNSENMLNDISLKRFGDTNDVANGVLFLASDKSSYIHGIDLDISGGKFIIQNSNLAYISEDMDD
jgi:NAD(P)-dependent dehydrogenase (short-subunit alcohol dehydrogenase family)